MAERPIQPRPINSKDRQEVCCIPVLLFRSSLGVAAAAAAATAVAATAVAAAVLHAI